jgi:hypothetical protein
LQTLAAGSSLTLFVKQVFNGLSYMSFIERKGIMSRLKRWSIACVMTLAAFAHAPVAQAQSVPTNVGTKVTAGTYNFDFANGSFFADGAITTDATGHATTIFGLVNGTDPITGLSTYAGADNDLYATGAWVTFGGLSFSTTSLGDFNFYNSGLGYYGLLSSRSDINGYPDGTIATARVAAVPEPTSWAMFLFGFAAIGLSVRTRSRSCSKLPQIA